MTHEVFEGLAWNISSFDRLPLGRGGERRSISPFSIVLASPNIYLETSAFLDILSMSSASLLIELHFTAKPLQSMSVKRKYVEARIVVVQVRNSTQC